MSKPKRKTRKQPEPPPPGAFIRSKTGRPARLVKTSETNPADEWLYRLDYGNVTGKATWTWKELLADGCKFLKRRPKDLPGRETAEDIKTNELEDLLG